VLQNSPELPERLIITLLAKGYNIAVATLKNPEVLALQRRL
jgi:hypothetical protein